MAQQKKKPFAKKFNKFNKFKAPNGNNPKQNVKRHILEDEEIKNLQEAYKNMPNTRDIKTFDEIPLSTLTRKGLKENKFKAPTEIQKQAIGPGLLGNDVLGAAITGSGMIINLINISLHNNVY
jgi:ATP-dependent RNA helicase DDX10/DBP4